MKISYGLKKSIITSGILFLFFVMLYIAFFLSVFLGLFIKSFICFSPLSIYAYCYSRPILFTTIDMTIYMLPIFLVFVSILFFAFKEIYFDSIKQLKKWRK